jgi:hypothetical protein
MFLYSALQHLLVVADGEASVGVILEILGTATGQAFHCQAVVVVITVYVLADKFVDILEREIADKRKQFASGKRSMAFSDEKQGVFLDNIEFLREQFEISKDENPSQKDGISALKVVYDERVKKLRSKAATDSKRLSHVFKFCEEVFGEGQEILILVTELTANYYCAHHIGK